MSELTERIRADRQLWRQCACPTHRAVRELVAALEDAEATLLELKPYEDGRISKGLALAAVRGELGGPETWPNVG